MKISWLMAIFLWRLAFGKTVEHHFGQEMHSSSRFHKFHKAVIILPQLTNVAVTLEKECYCSTLGLHNASQLKLELPVKKQKTNKTTTARWGSEWNITCTGKEANFSVELQWAGTVNWSTKRHSLLRKCSIIWWQPPALQFAQYWWFVCRLGNQILYLSESI